MLYQSHRNRCTNASRCNTFAVHGFFRSILNHPRESLHLSGPRSLVYPFTYCLLTLLLLLRLATGYSSMDHHNSNTRHKRKNSKLPLSNFSSTKSSSPNTFQLLRGDCKQTLLDLTPSLRLPATPARETSEFYDQINNLDPIKFSPPDSAGSTVGKMRPDRYVSHQHIWISHDKTHSPMQDIPHIAPLRCKTRIVTSATLRSKNSTMLLQKDNIPCSTPRTKNKIRLECRSHNLKTLLLHNFPGKILLAVQRFMRISRTKTRIRRSRSPAMLKLSGTMDLSTTKSIHTSRLVFHFCNLEVCKNPNLPGKMPRDMQRSMGTSPLAYRIQSLRATSTFVRLPEMTIASV